MAIAEPHLPSSITACNLSEPRIVRGQNLSLGLGLSLKKRYYIMFVSRDEEGTLNKVPVPLHFAYIFVAAAAIGMFTITGLAGSYPRRRIKTDRFNRLGRGPNLPPKDNRHLGK